MTDSEIADWFNYHKPTEAQVEAMQRWREGIAAVASDFVRATPVSGDVVVALRALKAAMMAMNAAMVSPMPKAGR
ncbi:MAG: hypothetical protein EOO38_11390 [Cytophagaceae bacterium]|nr:MAG: hypothetical protein EOO38_11390 [Cytophagaceae bacterium]